ncbi:linear amide C-N hydrolase [candidate division KSB1 bacterium]
MKFKKKTIYVLIFAGIFSALNIFCTDILSDTNARSQNKTQDLSLQEKLSLESLKKIDSYPMYKMTYYGDYGFSDFLKGKPSKKVQRFRNGFNDLENEHRCSCFAAMGDMENPLFGRNFDYFHRSSLILFTDPPNAYSSVSMVDIYYCGYLTNTPVSTLEERADLLYSPHLPFDGMNEKGVTVGLMAVPSAQPPHDPKKSTLYTLEVIRLILDYASDTEEAISLIEKYNVKFEEVPVHYMISDRTGRSAVIEYIKGEMKVIRNSRPFQISTNFIISNATPFLKNNCRRYDYLNNALNNSSAISSEEQGMDLLSGASQSNTMWSAVYNMQTGKILVVPGRKYNSAYEFNLPMTGF